MSKLITACIQMRASDYVVENTDIASGLIAEAASQGAQLITTPEMTNIMDIRRGAMREKAVTEKEDKCLAVLRDQAERLGVWLLIGSLGLKLDEKQRVNRSFLISPAGEIKARYDKIHMFDVELPNGETYEESRNYRPGGEAVVADTPFGRLGLTICYDLRFPHLYRALAKAGASYLTMPSAFTQVTGEAHWHVLLRARAIETGCFVFAAAQSGTHENGRKTFGHSLIVGPWGEVLADGGTQTGVVTADIDPARVSEARGRIPALQHDRDFGLPGA